MGLVRSLHEILAWAVIFVGFAVGVWATAAHWVDGARTSALWPAHHVFHFLVAAQVGCGAVLVGFTDVNADNEHMFYGFLCFVGIGIIVGYRHLSEYKYLLYGIGALFVMGLAIRALLLPPLVL